jgi:CRISPR-associated protein (TIGR02710 family)
MTVLCKRGSSMPKAPVLLLSIGTGSLDRQEETLFIPLCKSIAKGKWNHVVLLPSQITRQSAHELAARLKGVSVDIAPLPQDGQENDADACYAHFARVINGLRQQGLRPSDIHVDFTRGTKGMSAALVLAAVRHGIPTLRYITGIRDNRGMVLPGKEQIHEIKTTTASGHRLLDESESFFLRGNFAGVREILPDPSSPFAKLYPEEVKEVSGYAWALAAFYSAWDRLDYKAATKVKLLQPPPGKARWERFFPPSECTAWVRTLAQPLPGIDNDDRSQEMARRIRFIAVDLLANGARRIRDAHYEDAVIRAYRVLELVGQFRLWDKGLDSSALPPDHPAVIALQNKLEKNKDRERFGINRDNTLTAGRELSARLLKQMGDPISARLIELGNSSLLQDRKISKARNLSILIHGFEAVGLEDRKPLEEAYRKLEALLLEDGGNIFKKHLELASFPDFSRPGS